MDKISQIVAENITRLMKEKGLSQVALAKASGIDKDYLNRIVNGARRLGSEKEAPLALALGCEPIDFYRDRPLKSTLSEAARLLLAYEKAEPHTRQAIDRLLSLSNTNKIDSELDAFADQILGPRGSKEPKES